MSEYIRKASIFVLIVFQATVCIIFLTLMINPEVLANAIYINDGILDIMHNIGIYASYQDIVEHSTYILLIPFFLSSCVLLILYREFKQNRYSSGRRIVVTDLSVSVIIQIVPKGVS